ncbi:hypothetical protein AWC26_19885 [Mycobacterium shimoidei]|nr:hypothetical protein AWC26_19885 [Mycobacterium shimoidei]
MRAAVRRSALAVVAVAASAVAWVPTAVASPESDAADAITAAWEAAGGDNSEVGARQGDVYAIGTGFAANFANGKIFFTPDTGARALYGAVLDKYEALGGPANSDLGFPTTDEAPGLAGPDSRSSVFSASDTPVIFWTPEHGAYVVRGAMNAAWDKLGSSGGALGVPVGDETYDGEVATQPFSGGRVSWNRVTKTFTTTPPELAEQLTGLQVPIDATAAINLAWRSAGGETGPLGAKQGGQYPIGDDGQAQNFAEGKVFFSSATGANAVETDILAKYESLGGPTGDLGFPTTNEADGPIKPSRVSTFSATDEPVIFWTPDHGAFVVRGAIKAAWDKLRGAAGQLGPPVGDQTVDHHVVTQKFTGGQISWDRANNTFSTEPANLATALSGLQIPGQQSPSGVARPADTGSERAWQWWWLSGIIPVLLLLGLIALGVRRRRRRVTAARMPTPALEPERDIQRGYDMVPETDQQWEADTGSDLGPVPFSDAYAESAADVPDRPGVEWRPRARVGARLDEGRLDDDSNTAAIRSGFDQELADEDPDAVDTAPTGIPTASDVNVSSGGRHAAADNDYDEDNDYDDDAGLEPAASGGPAYPTIHLPLDDPHEPPDGYPVKGNASFGLYYTPDSSLYDDAFAEIWFSSEEVAQANGFTKAD